MTKINHSIKIGFGFGITSGIITTLGLIVGLHSGTHSQLAVIGGILTIAIADAFSDAMGIHVSEETENKHTTKELWESALSTFVAKFIFAMTFIIPILALPFETAIIACVLWGFLVLGVFSFYIARIKKETPAGIIAEHLVVALVVIVIAHFVGDWISTVFG